MSQDNRYQLPFRLSADHMQRLDKAAKYCGQTRQAFVQAAVLAEIAEVEERKRMKQLRVRPGVPEYEPLQQKEINTSSPTSSLVEVLRQRRQESEPVTPPPSTANQQGQVVVNVGNGGSGNTAVPAADIERLAAYVTSGSDFERDVRMRTATDILRATAATDEEKKVLAARLDEVVATKAKVNEGSVLKTARITFDKLAGFFGGGDEK